MAELGDLSPELHRQVGETMVKNGVEKMFGLGDSEIKFYLEGWKNGGGKTESARRFSDIDDLTKIFREELFSVNIRLTLELSLR